MPADPTLPLPARLWAVRDRDGDWFEDGSCIWVSPSQALAETTAKLEGGTAVLVGVSPEALAASERRVAELEATIKRLMIKAEAMRAVLAAASVKTDLTDEQLMAALDKAEAHIREHGIPREARSDVCL